MRALKVVCRIIFILAVPALLISASIGWAFNSLWLYKYGFAESNVSQTTGIIESELDKTARSIIAYFSSSDEYIDISVIKDGKPFPLFTEEEIIHFKDVKVLVWLDYKVFFVALAYCLVFSLVCLFWRRPKYRRYLAWSVVGGSGLTLLLMAIIGISSLFNFDQLFLQFHFLAFTNTFWSTPGYMIMIFGGIMFPAVIFAVSITAGLSIVLGGVATAFIVINKPD